MKSYKNQFDCVFCGDRFDRKRIESVINANTSEFASVKCERCELRNKFTRIKKGKIRNHSRWEIGRYYRSITFRKSKLSVSQKLLIMEAYKQLQYYGSI